MSCYPGISQRISENGPAEPLEREEKGSVVPELLLTAVKVLHETQILESTQQILLGHLKASILARRNPERYYKIMIIIIL